MIRYLNLFFFCYSFLFFANCSDCSTSKEPDASLDVVMQKKDKSTIVARVDDKVITLGELENSMLDYSLSGGNSLDKAGNSKNEEFRIRESVLNGMIDELILDIEADNQNVTVNDTELDKEIELLLGDYDRERFKMVLAEKGMQMKDWADMLKRRLKVKKLLEQHFDETLTLSEKEISEYYKDAEAEFKIPHRIRLYQIVLSGDAVANKVYQKLRSGDDFSELAKEYSISPEAVKGGDMGYFSKGELPSDIEAVVFKLKENKISSIFQSEYGFHIFKVVKIEDGRKLSYNEAKGRIRRVLFLRKRELEYTKWLKELKQDRTILIEKEALL